MPTRSLAVNTRPNRGPAETVYFIAATAELRQPILHEIVQIHVGSVIGGVFLRLNVLLIRTLLTPHSKIRLNPWFLGCQIDSHHF